MFQLFLSIPSYFYCFVSTLLALFLVVISTNDAFVEAFVAENKLCTAPAFHINNHGPFSAYVSRKIRGPDNFSTILCVKNRDDGNTEYFGQLHRALKTGHIQHLGKRDKRWVERCQELVDYKQKHGDYDAPQPASKHKKKTTLTSWMVNQRTQYRLHQQGEKSSMTKERIAILEDIGFQWKIIGWTGKHADWKMRYDDLIEPKAKYGDCNAPLNFSENGKLATWVNRKRKAQQDQNEGRVKDPTLSRTLRRRPFTFWRQPRTQNERRQLTGLTQDYRLDCRELGVELSKKSRVRVRARSIPSSWDDEVHSCWGEIYSKKIYPRGWE